MKTIAMSLLLSLVSFSALAEELPLVVCDWQDVNVAVDDKLKALKLTKSSVTLSAPAVGRTDSYITICVTVSKK